ncbi:MAG: cytidine/deoxycytidylate deaminase family protein [Clostridia bacterium]|nr:cytidine/deoxycytidylate deaminase family protein [Clostridia bacterium]
MDKWDKRFMEICEVVSTWSSCAREGRQIGAIITKDKRILTTGYNGAPAGILNCRDKGYCMRDEMGIKSGTCQEMCYAVHAEQNAIIQAAKLGLSVDGATLYCTHQPCTICTRMIINSGIAKIIYKHPYPDEFAMKLIKESGIVCEQFSE